MPDQPSPKKVPLGKLTPRTEEELDALATISPADLVAANDLWKKAAPPALRGLLEAEPVEP